NLLDVLPPCVYFRELIHTTSALVPYTTLFRSVEHRGPVGAAGVEEVDVGGGGGVLGRGVEAECAAARIPVGRGGVESVGDGDGAARGEVGRASCREGGELGGGGGTGEERVREW